jgi:hypothetical protein
MAATKVLTIDNIITDKNVIKTPIYRFKFSDEFVSELSEFSKIHQYDDRHTFKEAWEDWVADNEDLISLEMRRLTNMGYDGDVLDKMFKSARYYFRKKSAEKKAPATRRQYVNVDKQLLDAMDQHIMENIDDDDYQPKEGFDKFCKENLDLLKIVVDQICESGIRDANEIKDKIKKTYKNRYFNIVKK